MAKSEKTASAPVAKTKATAANKSTTEIKVKTGPKAKVQPKTNTGTKAATKVQIEVTPKSNAKPAAKAEAKAKAGARVNAGSKANAAQVMKPETKSENKPKANEGASDQSKTVTDKNKATVEQKAGGKKQSKLTKKQFSLICVAAAVVIAVLVAILILVLNRKPVEIDTDEDEVVEMTQEVDYDQKITSEDGGAFKAEYQAGSEKSFAVRFADLECEEGCKNVDEVKLGKKVLERGEDYEVKKGSIIIILTEDFMKGVKAGKHDLIIAVVDGGRTLLYGVKFTVKAEPTCGEGEKLEKGECVKEEKEEEKEDEKKESDNESTAQPEQPRQPETADKSQAEIDCENQEGPRGFVAVHWTSENEITDGAMSGTIGMHRVNGVCRPNVSEATDLTGRGFGTEGLPVDEHTHPLILQNRGQDIIIWTWADSSQTVEKVPSAFDVWSY